MSHRRTFQFWHFLSMNDSFFISIAIKVMEFCGNLDTAYWYLIILPPYTFILNTRVFEPYWWWRVTFPTWKIKISNCFLKGVTHIHIRVIKNKDLMLFLESAISTLFVHTKRLNTKDLLQSFSLKSVHFKKTVAQFSFLSKVLSFLLTLFWFQWKWQHFWKKWGLRNCLLKMNFTV